jgi:exopolyphosphatase/guanosine-5'-triphosphate,3'-diphosphate pyrophosphatase
MQSIGQRSAPAGSTFWSPGSASPRERLTRVAAVDLGTNSTRLLVADVEAERLDEVVQRLTITRLGEGVDRRKRLLPTPIARVRNCLADYRRELESHGATRTLAVATSAVRDAENGDAFLGEIEWSYGFTTRVLDGAEEAALTYRGVTVGRDPLDETLVVDIGGGSTELVLGSRNGPVASASIDVGCVRVTERFLGSDPPTGQELDSAARYVRSLLPSYQARRAIGVAGTVTTSATLDLALPAWDPARTHEHLIARTSVERHLDRLAALSLEERLRVSGLEPGRAPVIVAGLVILREIMDAYDLQTIEASEHDILHGAALAAAELPEPEEGAAPSGAYTCC